MKTKPNSAHLEMVRQLFKMGFSYSGDTNTYFHSWADTKNDQLVEIDVEFNLKANEVNLTCSTNCHPEQSVDYSLDNEICKFWKTLLMYY